MKNVFSELLNKTSIFHSSAEVIKLVESRLERRESINVAFINAHAYNLACRDESFFRALKESDMLLRDGIGVEILYRLLGKNAGANLNGTDLIPKLLERTLRQKSVAIYGSDERELGVAVSKLKSRGYNIVDSLNGFKEEEDYIESLETHSPEVVLLAMGMPKQEQLAQVLHSKSNALVTISGGAIIDFMAGKVRRAPRWIRSCKMEWLYRLLMEPRRLFHRYVVGNFVFLYRIVLYKLTQGKKYA